MADFARGAKVRKPPTKAEAPLTMVEASYVMCSIAKANGFHAEALFLGYMQRAWRTFNQIRSPDDSTAEPTK